MSSNRVGFLDPGCARSEVRSCHAMLAAEKQFAWISIVLRASKDNEP
jgi:hypothetical protein